MKEAKFWERKNGSKVNCLLCPHKCSISDGKRGICGVRENKNGTLYSLVYGLTTGIAVDPIEKKPLFHFHPGTDIFSLGTVGCNMKCMHCQNYSTSQASVEDCSLQKIDLKDIIQLANRYACGGIAWTYNEPTIWYEFTFDSSKLAKKNSLYTVYVTNGYINPEPLKALSPYLDAMNIDVKAFTDDFYRKISKARLQPVLDTCVLAKQLGIFIELTYLVIPTYNDSETEIRNYCKWVVDKLGDEIPVHFSRFHPEYKMLGMPATPIETLDIAYNIAKEEGLKYVYLGNVMHSEKENTYCRNCNSLLIERYGFSARKVGLEGKRCKKCNTELSLIL